MNNNNNLSEFGSFIDELRKSRNLSREDFIDGVISLRQYQRYVNGETSLNNDKLFKLIDKLEMNFFNVHRIFLKKTSDEYAKLSKVYGEIGSQNAVRASELIEEINYDDLKDSYNRTFYKLCNLLILKRTNRMPNIQFIDKIKALINYPKCLNNKLINFVEYIAYIQIALHSEDEDGKSVTNFLYKKIKDDNITTDSILNLYIPSTYSLVSQKLGAMGEFEKSFTVSNKGIKWCLKAQTHNSLSHLYLFSALSLRNLERHEESLLEAKKMFAMLLVEGKDTKIEKFTKVFEDAFNIKASEL